MTEAFDYIVVGGGSAGCVLARRLSDRSDRTVLLLESGGSDDHPLISMPLAFNLFATHSRITWGLTTEPEPYANDRRLGLPRGRVLGGTSSINAMTYTRGQRADYDSWTELGVLGWGYDDVLPYFKKAERNWRGETEFHGGDGPLGVVRPADDPVFFPALVAAAQRLGLRVTDDIQASDEGGLSQVEYTIADGRRASTAARYLRPVRGRPNLSVLTGAHAQRILIEAGVATGVEYRRSETVHSALARREVILCGGAYHSPQLLLLSGVGPAEELRQQGVTPIHDLPGVGKGLSEHVQTGVICSVNTDATLRRQLRFDRLALTTLRWLLTRKGAGAWVPLTAWGFFKSRPELDRPDVEAIFVASPPGARVWFPFLRKGVGHAFSLYISLLRPKSRGEVTLASADPLAKPRIKLNMLQEAGDLKVLRDGLRLMRKLAGVEPLAGLLKDELRPGPDVDSDAELDDYLIRTAGPWHHPVGSCAMGAGPMAVVDSRLKVHGLQRLRVADASVIPLPVSGNTNAPVIMVAEKAADLILGEVD